MCLHADDVNRGEDGTRRAAGLGFEDLVDASRVDVSRVLVVITQYDMARHGAGSAGERCRDSRQKKTGARSHAMHHWDPP